MSGLLPSETDDAAEKPADGTDDQIDEDVTDGDGPGEDVRIMWLDDEEADELIGSLSSDTARSVLTALHEQPRTASELSEQVETSVQNVRHHLTNLQDSGLVRVAETRYSVKGREMNVYEPTDDSLVVCVGSGDDRDSLLDSIRGLVGVTALLAAASLFVGWGYDTAVGGGSAPSMPRVPTDAGGTTGSLLGLVDPGVAFLAGGVFVLVAVIAFEYRRR